MVEAMSESDPNDPKSKKNIGELDLHVPKKTKMTSLSKLEMRTLE